MDASRKHVTMLGGVGPSSGYCVSSAGHCLSSIAKTSTLRALSMCTRKALLSRTSEFAVRQSIKGGLDKVLQIVLLFKLFDLRTGSFALGPAACDTGLHPISAQQQQLELGSGALGLTFLRSPLVPGFCPSNGLVSRIVQARCLLMLVRSRFDLALDCARGPLQSRPIKTCTTCDHLLDT